MKANPYPSVAKTARTATALSSEPHGQPSKVEEMKGLLFTLSKDAGVSAREAMLNGIFGVWMPRLDEGGNWKLDSWITRGRSPLIATFADYLTITPGDKVFFFQDRQIYGIGEVIQHPKAPPRRGAILNYADADQSTPKAEPTEEQALFSNVHDWRAIRIVVPFVESPAFFSGGIDMDEVLSSPGSEACWGLKTWQGKSFTYLGETETELLVQAFLRRYYPRADTLMPKRTGPELTEFISSRYSGVPSMRNVIRTNPSRYLRSGELKDENCLHALLIEQLVENDRSFGPAFYREDRGLVFHEVPASPSKPVVYIDKIDVMATRKWSEELDFAAHYDILEAKKDKFGGKGKSFGSEVTQIAKYVDFVARNYAGGNYGAISAYLIAKDFSSEFLGAFVKAKTTREFTPDVAAFSRSYILNSREKNATKIWNDLSLLKYEWDETEGRLVLREPVNIRTNVKAPPEVHQDYIA